MCLPLKVITINVAVGIYCFGGATTFHPHRIGPGTIDPHHAYELVENQAQRLPPVLALTHANSLIEVFFQQQIMLPLVLEEVFLEHRRLWYSERTIRYGFSWSLEYAIYACAANLLGWDISRELESKAKLLLNFEQFGGLLTYASVEASILLSWLDCGSDRAGSYSATARGLIVDFGANIDPSYSLSLHPMTPEEADTRRVLFWKFFVYDRYCDCRKSLTFG